MSDSEGHQRAQSELIGIVLLFALVITVSLTVVVVGSSTIGNVQSSTTTESAEITMMEFQSEAEAAGSHQSEAQEITFAQSSGARPANNNAAGMGEKGGNPGAVDVDDKAGHIEVTVDTASGNRTIADTDLGTVTYRRDGQIVAYQGGGVFRANSNAGGSAVVSPPPVDYQYRNERPTLTFPIMTIQGSTNGEDFVLKKGTKTRAKNAPTPIQPGDLVTVTIESEYCEGWAKVFNQRTGKSTSCSGDTLEITLDGPPAENPTVAGPLSISPNGEFTVDNKAYMSNYNSTGTPSYNTWTYIRGSWNARDGTNSAGQGVVDGNLMVENKLDIEAKSNSDNFKVGRETVVGGDVHLDCKCEFGFRGGETTNVGGDFEADGSGNSMTFHGDVVVDGDVTSLSRVTIKGDLHVNGDLDVKNPKKVDIQGDIYVEGSYDSKGWSVAGSSAEDPEPIDFPAWNSVSQKINARDNLWDDDNDNPGAAETSDIENGKCSSGCNIDDGKYHFDRLFLEPGSGKMIFDARDGPVRIYVDGTMKIKGPIEIKGDNPVSIYVDDEVQWQEGGSVDTPHSEPHAPSLWVYAHPDESIDIHSGGFVGVIYAPGNGGVPIEVGLGNKEVLHGALVGEVEVMNMHTNIEFDEALLGVKPGSGGGSNEGDSVTWLRVSTSPVEVLPG